MIYALVFGEEIWQRTEFVRIIACRVDPAQQNLVTNGD